MTEYSVAIMPLAMKDIVGAAKCIAENNPAAAARWLDRTEFEIHSLKQFPARSPQGIHGMQKHLSDEELAEAGW